MIELASSPCPFFEGKEEKGPGTHCLCMRQNPQKFCGFIYFRKNNITYNVYCHYNKHKLSVILQFISTVRLLWTFVGIFLHENSSRRLLRSWQGSRANLKPKFGEPRRRILLSMFRPVCVSKVATSRYWLVIFLHLYSIEAP